MKILWQSCAGENCLLECKYACRELILLPVVVDKYSIVAGVVVVVVVVVF